jgi:rhodanese-related sulfurtransferase
MPISPVLSAAPAHPDVAAAFFTTRLACQTDVADVAAALASGRPGFVLLDSRNDAAWLQGRIPGAHHLPTAAISGAALDPDAVYVTYCWGPGCDGATRAALAVARRGLRVKEMLGGFEYWVREGFPVATDHGTTTGPVDHLTAPCGCS